MNYKIVLHLYKYKFLNVINKTEKKNELFFNQSFFDVSVSFLLRVYLYMSIITIGNHKYTLSLQNTVSVTLFLSLRDYRYQRSAI